MSSRFAVGIPRLTALVAIAALTAPPARAAVIHVTVLDDATGGPSCTLRDAMHATETDLTVGGCPAGSGADVIDLGALAGTIVLAAPLPTLGSSGADVTIVGPGADVLAVSGDGQYVVFTNANVVATTRLVRLTIRDGSPHCVLGEGNTSIEDARVTAGAGDQQVSDAMVGSLTDNGGPTATHALLEGSPAIDAGLDPCYGPDEPLTEDQRGFPRPHAGAFELPEVGSTLAGVAALSALRLVRRARRRAEASRGRG